MSQEERRPPWFDPAVPAREDCVLKAMLDARAARHPDRRFALFEDGSTWTYRECRDAVRAAAGALQQLGVGKGDRVIAWLPSGREMVLTWFAANYLGAVFVPLNTAYRGDVLAHVVNASGGRLMVAHHSLVERLDDLALQHLRQVIAVGGPATSRRRDLDVLEQSVLRGDGTSLDDSAQIEHWDIQSIIYTSGTTGHSQGVLSPYLQLDITATVCYGYMADGESILVNLPMFHVGGTSPTYCALLRSGSIYVVDGFSTTRFWDQVREGACVTTSGLIGVMGAFLAKAEPRPDDADNPLRCLTMFPINEDTVRMAERFGFDYMTGFNMTEVSSPLVTDVNTRVFGSCGRPRSGIQARLVDEHDVEVPHGEMGELILRS
ncbi:MAG TPA: AMP-binding protein, partial [Steroidobacteraceae bacterium]